MFSSKWFRFLCLFSVLILFSCDAMAANTDVARVGEHQYDLVVIVSSFITFCFNQLFKILTFVEEGLISMQHGDFDVPVFGSVYRAMKYAGMIDYTFPSGIHGNENLIVDTLCDVGLRLIGAIKKLLEYMEMNIQNGYFPGVLRNFFDYLDVELQKYEFYKAGHGFVTSLPGYRINEVLVDVAEKYLKGHF